MDHRWPFTTSFYVYEKFDLGFPSNRVICGSSTWMKKKKNIWNYCSHLRALEFCSNLWWWWSFCASLLLILLPLRAPPSFLEGAEFAGEIDVWLIAERMRTMRRVNSSLSSGSTNNPLSTSLSSNAVNHYRVSSSRQQLLTEEEEQLTVCLHHDPNEEPLCSTVSRLKCWISHRVCLHSD